MCTYEKDMLQLRVSSSRLGVARSWRSTNVYRRYPVMLGLGKTHARDRDSFIDILPFISVPLWLKLHFMTVNCYDNNIFRCNLLFILVFNLSSCFHHVLRKVQFVGTVDWLKVAALLVNEFCNVLCVSSGKMYLFWENKFSHSTQRYVTKFNEGKVCNTFNRLTV